MFFWPCTLNFFRICRIIKNTDLKMSIWKSNINQFALQTVYSDKKNNLNITHKRMKCPEMLSRQNVFCHKKFKEATKTLFKRVPPSLARTGENQSIFTRPRSHCSHQDGCFSCESFSVCLAAVVAVAKLWAKGSEGHR